MAVVITHFFHRASKLQRFALKLKIPNVNTQSSYRYHRRKGLRRQPIGIIQNGQVLKPTGDFHRDSSEESHDSFLEYETVKNMSNEQQNYEESGIPAYEKLGEKNTEFTKTLALLKSRKQREKKGWMLLEGRRLISDAITAGVPLLKLFFSKEENIKEIPLRDLENVKIMKVFYNDLQLWSDMTTCPGVMGVFKIPDYNSLTLPTKNLLPVTVICDNVRDPGNMGSIIRCAAAAGCRKLLLTKGCVDVWEPKVLRAGSGGHFRIEIVNNIYLKYLLDYFPETARLYVADNECAVMESQEPDMKKTVQNLNQEHLVNARCYTDVNYSGTEAVLVVGGETEGLSDEILQLCKDKMGVKLNIPMVEGVESLNSAIAVAVIMFEMKRQYTEAGNLVTNVTYLKG